MKIRLIKKKCIINYKSAFKSLTNYYIKYLSLRVTKPTFYCKYFDVFAAKTSEVKSNGLKPIKTFLFISSPQNPFIITLPGWFALWFRDIISFSKDYLLPNCCISSVNNIISLARKTHMPYTVIFIIWFQTVK